MSKVYLIHTTAADTADNATYPSEVRVRWLLLLYTQKLLRFYWNTAGRGKQKKRDKFIFFFDGKTGNSNTTEPAVL